MTDDMQDSAPATDALATFPKPIEPVALPEAVALPKPVALCAQCVYVTLPGMCTCGANLNALPPVEPLHDEPAHDDDFGGMSAV